MRRLELGLSDIERSLKDQRRRLRNCCCAFVGLFGICYLMAYAIENYYKG